MRRRLAHAARAIGSPAPWSVLLELAGIALIVVGLHMLAPWLGVLAAGGGLLTIGLVLEPVRRRRSTTGQ